MQSIIPPVGGPISFTCDALDNQITKTDGNGRTWTTEDDANGNRLTRTPHPDGRAVQMTYDRAGNQVTLTSPSGVTTTACDTATA